MNCIPNTVDSLSFTSYNFCIKDHPILGHPVFHIHPCNTTTMMRNLLTDELDVKSHQYAPCYNTLVYL